MKVMGIKSSVSLYSLQYEYLHGKMSLEDIVKFMKELNVEGIEILPDQMIPGAPTPSDRACTASRRDGRQMQMNLSRQDKTT